MDFLTWSAAGQILTVVITLAGLFQAARLKKALRAWRDVVEAVRTARADKRWTTGEVDLVLHEVVEAISATLPLSGGLFRRVLRR